MTAVPRLILVQATYELIDAAIDDPVRLGQLLRAEVADDWPGFPESLSGLRNAYSAGRDGYAWGTVLFVLEEPRTLVGMGGYKGDPTPEGVVEIGYAIAPAFQGRGLATEGAGQLIRQAFADPRVRAVDAHTLAAANPSTRVLEKLGLQRIAEKHDPDDGPIWQWRIQRPSPAGPSSA